MSLIIIKESETMEEELEYYNKDHDVFILNLGVGYYNKNLAELLDIIESGQESFLDTYNKVANYNNKIKKSKGGIKHVVEKRSCPEEGWESSVESEPEAETPYDIEELRKNKRISSSTIEVK